MTDKPSRPALPGSSSFSGGSAGRPLRPAAAPPASLGSRFNPPSGNRLPPTPPRFGQTQTEWETIPTATTCVRFSLAGLGGSLRGLLTGTAHNSFLATLQELEPENETYQQIRQTLDTAWAEYNLTGAMLVYNFSAATDEIIVETARLIGAKAAYWRAVDPLLVLNVLARSRANLLQAHAPLSFDEEHLKRTLISDDPRLIRLVEDTGYFEESIPQAAHNSEDLDE